MPASTIDTGHSYIDVSLETKPDLLLEVTLSYFLHTSVKVMKKEHILFQITQQSRI